MFERHRAQGFLLVCLALLVCGCVSSAVYHPSRHVRHTPAERGLTFEEVSIETEDGVVLSGWWVPSAASRGTVLFCHGNGGSISNSLETVVLCNRLMLDVLIFDYRGYGKSTGVPTEGGTYQDADAAWRYLGTEKMIAPERIIIWGRSLGGAIAARTAANHPPGLLIVESAFTSLKDLVRDRFAWVPSSLFEDFAYDTRTYLGKVTVPVLVIHSVDDELVPFSHGKALYDSVRGPKAFLEIRGSHNRGFIDSVTLYESRIRDELEQYVPVHKEGSP